jgi:hypothetical protein
MSLIFWYLGFMIAGDVLAYLLGGLVEYEWGSRASLIVFLALYFLFLWVSWLLAVRVTRPKEGEAAVVVAAQP